MQITTTKMHVSMLRWRETTSLHKEQQHFYQALESLCVLRGARDRVRVYS